MRTRTRNASAGARWTAETHPTLRYLARRGGASEFIGSDAAALGLKNDESDEAVEARARVNDFLRATNDSGSRQGQHLCTPLHYLCVEIDNPDVQEGFDVPYLQRRMAEIRALLYAGADPEVRSSCWGDSSTACRQPGSRTVLLAVAQKRWFTSSQLKRLIVVLLTARGADLRATLTVELSTRFGTLPHETTCLGTALIQLFDSNIHVDEISQSSLIAHFRQHGARLTDGDYFTMWIDRYKRREKSLIDRYGAALKAANAWSFPPCFFRAARELTAETSRRDGPLGRGLGHETALVKTIFSYLGRGDVVGFFPERLDSVIYSPKEQGKWRKRGRARTMAREFPAGVAR